MEYLHDSSSILHDKIQGIQGIQGIQEYRWNMEAHL
jgi:hypothetical protein